MELKELVDETLKIFEINNVKDLAGELMKACVKNDESKFRNFKALVRDLNIDWLQKIFQYYEADRKEKKQDYTPKSLAALVGQLAGSAEVIIDMCAGSGALTIQKWARNKNQRFELYEFDEKVIAYLLFNMMVRNINCTVYQADVLQDEIYHEYRVKSGLEFGELEVIK